MEILDNSKDLSLLNLDSLTNEDRDNINDFQRLVDDEFEINDKIIDLCIMVKRIQEKVVNQNALSADDKKELETIKQNLNNLFQEQDNLRDRQAGIIDKYKIRKQIIREKKLVVMILLNMLLNAKKNNKDIMRLFDFSENSLICFKKIINENQKLVEWKDDSKPKETEYSDPIIKLYMAFFSPEEISEIVMLSRKTIVYYIKNHIKDDMLRENLYSTRNIKNQRPIINGQDYWNRKPWERKPKKFEIPAKSKLQKQNKDDELFLNQKKLDQIKGLYSEGLSEYRIAKILGDTESNIRDTIKIAKRKKKWFTGDELIRIQEKTLDTIKRLYISGDSLRKIYKRLGVKSIGNLVTKAQKNGKWLTKKEEEIRKRNIYIYNLIEIKKCLKRFKSLSEIAIVTGMEEKAIVYLAISDIKNEILNPEEIEWLKKQPINTIRRNVTKRKSKSTTRRKTAKNLDRNLKHKRKKKVDTEKVNESNKDRDDKKGNEKHNSNHSWLNGRTVNVSIDYGKETKKPSATIIRTKNELISLDHFKSLIVTAYNKGGFEEVNRTMDRLIKNTKNQESYDKFKEYMIWINKFKTKKIKELKDEGKSDDEITYLLKIKYSKEYLDAIGRIQELE